MKISFGLHLWVFLGLALIPSLSFAKSGASENNAAVILTYHRVGEDAYPDTNIRIDQFTAHINELKKGGYTILPIQDLVSAMKHNINLPPKSIVITFEGAYKSAMAHAVPLLLDREIPFTIFFATDHADSNVEQHANWADIKRLSRYKFVSFGLHPASYTRLSGQKNSEILEQVNKARARYRKHLGQEPKVFSYPFGEYSRPYRDLIESQGFDAAFGLHSGAAWPANDIFSIPRFTMTESYGDFERFKLVTNALPLPVHSIEPHNPYLSEDRPSIGFTIPYENLAELNLSCFVSGQPRPEIEILGQNRVELKLSEDLPEGRTRINCTLPLQGKKNEAPRWRWFGMLLVKKTLEPTETSLLRSGLQ